jgi:acyl dehydratase
MSNVLCLEDFTLGQVIELGSTSVSAEEIVQFGRAYDPQAFHVDPEAAARSPFGDLIASEWHTAALFMRLYTDQILLRSACLGSPGVSDLRWRSPVRPGQVLHARVTIERVEPSAKRDDRGTVWPVCEFRDDAGETIFSMILLTLLRRRSAAPGASEARQTAS